jgi:hypothetical protein
MGVLFKCMFQSEPQFGDRAIGRDAASLVAREAFPLSPPASAVSDPRYSSFKIAPAGSGRVLVSVTRNRGERDRFGRSVLTATGCVLQLNQMSGPLRELPTLWRALKRDDFGLEWASFEAQISRESLCGGGSTFERMIAALSAHGQFHAQVAWALVSSPTTVYLPDEPAVPELLEPAFALLPLGWIGRLHFASGATESSCREAAIGTMEAPQDPPRSSSKWSLGIRREAVIVNVPQMRVYGLQASPFASLAEAITDRNLWPGFDIRSRYAMITRCLDSPVIVGRSQSPFDLDATLDAIRRGVRSAEGFAQVAQELLKRQ